MAEEKDIHPKITINRNKLSMAFSLISFMVGEIVVIEKAIRSPLDLDKFPELSEEDFLHLKAHQLEILKH